MTVSVDRDELVAAGYFVEFQGRAEWCWGLHDEVYGDGHRTAEGAWRDAAEDFVASRPGWDD